MKNVHLQFLLLFVNTFLISIFFSTFLTGQAASSLFPDITEFKLEYPLDNNGNDYEGVAYNDRDDPHIKTDVEESLGGYVAPSPYNQYFFVSGNELVMKAHCAGALTSVNAYPRCELRQQINGENTFWDYSDEHELNVTLRITEVPDLKREVCVVQAKGTNTPSTTSGTKEVLRVEYRADGNSGWHLEVNESSGPTNILDYSLGQSVHIRVYVNNDNVILEMENLDNGDTYELEYDSDFSHGYFKTGAYTQSSIWGEKNGVGDEDPDASGEVRFSQIELGETNGGQTCTPQAPSNRNVSNVGQTSATLSWNAVADVENYDLRYKPTSSSTWTYNTNYVNTSLTISGLATDTEYEWQIKSVCPNGDDTNYSQGVGPNFTTNGGGQTCTPQAPSNRSASNVGQSSATLSWNAVADVENYDLRYKPTSLSTWMYNTNYENTSLTISGLSSDTEYEWQIKSVCPNGDDTNYSQGPGPNFTTSGGGSGNTFTPDPNKTYHIDVPIHNLRLGASGTSEDAYTTLTTTTGDDVEWKFVAKGNGYWHVQRAAGGSKPRLRTDNSINADMQATSSSGSFTYYEFTEGNSSGTWFMTLPDGPSNYHRLQVNSAGDIKFVTTNSAGTWESFTFTEVDNSNNGLFTPDPNKIYHINVPHHNLRIAATGASEDAYTTSTSTIGDDVEWKFVAKGNGYWHVQRAAGGSKPRLRTDNSVNADMQATSSSGSFTYYEFTEGNSSGTWFMTLPDGPSNYHRLQVNSAGDIKFVTTNSAGTWESFTFTEVSGGGGCTTSAPSNRQVNSVTNASASVSWNSTGADNYDVRYKKVADSDWKYKNDNSGSSTTITGIVESTTYEWQVRGQCDDGSASDWTSGQGPNFTTANNFTRKSLSSTRSENSDDTFLHSAIIVYPNPAFNEITLDGIEDGESIQIFNVRGQVVIESKAKTISILNLQKGIYFVRFQNRPTSRFIKL